MSALDRPRETPEDFALILRREHIGALNDALYELIRDPDNDPEDTEGYEALRDDIKRQLLAQRDDGEAVSS